MLSCNRMRGGGNGELSTNACLPSPPLHHHHYLLNPLPPGPSMPCCIIPSSLSFSCMVVIHGCLSIFYTTINQHMLKESTHLKWHIFSLFRILCMWCSIWNSSASKEIGAWKTAGTWQPTEGSWYHHIVTGGMGCRDDVCGIANQTGVAILIVQSKATIKGSTFEMDYKVIAELLKCMAMLCMLSIYKQM